MPQKVLGLLVQLKGNQLTCLMAAPLPGPLGGQLAGAQGRGVPDGLSPVLGWRGAAVLSTGAVPFQPPGTWGEGREELEKGTNHQHQGEAARCDSSVLAQLRGEPGDRGGAVLAQRCQLAVAVPGVPGDGQSLHLVQREVSGQLREPVVLQVGGFQHGHTSKCVVCKLKGKGLW